MKQRTHTILLAARAAPLNVRMPCPFRLSPEPGPMELRFRMEADVRDFWVVGFVLAPRHCIADVHWYGLSEQNELTMPPVQSPKLEFFWDRDAIRVPAGREFLVRTGPTEAHSGILVVVYFDTSALHVPTLPAPDWLTEKLDANQEWLDEDLPDLLDESPVPESEPSDDGSDDQGPRS